MASFPFSHRGPGRRRPRDAASLLRIALGLVLLPLAAPAETVTFSGTWTDTGTTAVPTIPVPAGTNQTSYSAYNGGNYSYSLFTFTVTKSGDYSAIVGTTLTANTSWFLTGLFSPGTPPSTPIENFFAGVFAGGTPVDGRYTDSFGSVTLTEGTTYSLLLAYATGIPSMAYQVLLSGPGCAAFASLTTCSANILPGGASLASGLGSTVLPAFQGGTLLVDTSGQTYGQNFTLGAAAGNTIDSSGHDVTFSGAFSDAAGPGSLVIANSGTGGAVTLTGASTYTGPTTIGAGATLALSGSGSIAASAGVLNNGRLDIGGTGAGAAITSLGGSGTVALGGQTLTLTQASGSFSGSIGGTGGLTIDGGGMTLTGASTYTGPTTINAGAALSVNGSLASTVAVNTGGLLRGTGSVGGITVANGALVAPGNSPGTLTVTGAVTMQPAAAALFDIDGTGTDTGAGNYSRLVLTGAAGRLAAGGLLIPQLRGIAGSATNGFTPGVGTLFRIISAQGGVGGSFAGLAQPEGLAQGTRFDALYSPNAVDLVVTPSLYGTSALAGWAAPVGRALDNARPSAGVAMTAGQAAVYAPLYQLGAAQLPAALQQMAPLVYADRMMLQRDGFRNVGSVIGAEPQSRRGAPATSTAVAGPGSTTAWLSGSGEFMRLENGGNGTPGYHGSTGGVVGGIDTAPLPAVRLGVAMAFGSQTVSFGNQGRYTGQSAQLMAYGSLQRGGYVLDGSLGVAFNEGSFRRPLWTYGTAARADSSGIGAGGSLRVGRRFEAGGWNIEPGAMLRGVSLSSDSARETRGGQPGLRVEGQSLGSLETQLGARVDRRFPLSRGHALAVSAELGWALEMLDTRAQVTASFLGLAGSGFTLRSAPAARDAVVAGAVATLETGTPLRAFVGYNVRAGERYTSQSITGGPRYSF